MEMSGGPAGPGAPPAGGVPPAHQQGPYPGGPAPYGGSGQYAGHEQQSGFADEAARFAQRHIRTPETKEFFKTSEFFVWVITVIGILIAANSISGGRAHDFFNAALAWTLITVLSVGYMLSRGLSKTGARRSRLDD